MFLNESLFKDFLSQRDILWTGINFSKAKLTKQGFDFPQDVLQYYFNGWNSSIINNQKKFDIRLSFQKPIMRYDLAMVTKMNKGAKASHLLTNVIAHQDILNETLVCSYITENCVIESETPYALTFLVEYLDSIAKRASIWVVIYKTSTGEVALAEDFLLKPGGFGTNNYWGRTFYNLLFDIKTSAFIRWKNLVQGNPPASSEEGQ